MPILLGAMLLVLALPANAYVGGPIIAATGALLSVIGFALLALVAIFLRPLLGIFRVFGRKADPVDMQAGETDAAMSDPTEQRS